jgi:hypothetical protein
MRARPNEIAAVTALAFALCVAAPAFAADEGPEATWGNEVWSIPFTGQASGGTLMLCDTLNRNTRCAILETTPGESAESVARRLAQVINETDPFEWLSDVRLSGPRPSMVSSSGGTLRGLLAGGYIIAGTETGLGIPPPPVSLTCNYVPSSDAVVFKWRNPPGGYDRLRLVLNWDNYNHTGGMSIPGTAESYTLDLRARAEGMAADLDLWLIGLRKEIPSNAAAMHVSNNVQEELSGVPFTCGVAPNWTAWSLDGPGAAKAAMESKPALMNRAGISYNAVDRADKKPYVQVIQSDGEAGGTGGVARTFLGLTPGDTYRVTVRVNTMPFLSNRPSLRPLGPPRSLRPDETPDWSCSVHVACGGPAARNLTARQMAGLDTLPDGAKGPSADEVRHFEHQLATNHKYQDCTKQLVLPEGADSITVWVRFTSRRKGDAVAINDVKLEYLGPQHPPTTSQP